MVTFKSEILNSLTSFDRNPHRILACSYILSCCDCRFPHFDSLASRLGQSLTSSCLCCNLVLCLEWRIKPYVWVWSLTQFSYFPFRVSFAHLCLGYIWQNYSSQQRACWRILRFTKGHFPSSITCNSHFWQNLPEYPAGQLQVKGSVHWPPCWQGGWHAASSHRDPDTGGTLEHYEEH